MPQMSPLKWLTLMLTFVMIFFMFNLVNFFFSSYSPSQVFQKWSKTSKPWKW
uniref:ATP synthase complex subunit 8 n=1 Tax=Prismognathus prossi TaxID=618395 RepID=A0A5C1VAB6_9SCAR|nr:ATP synthase F0 subunit 8 [Prismognathus prossi]QEN73225.1 ATP synthase F0 subunit 8 [Prismognathus prossi]